jgi:hypothetical protein
LSVEQAEKEDGVLVENPDAVNVDEEFQYVSHGDAPAETDKSSSNPPSPARRQPIVNKGKKEPSYIATPTAPV